jgi:hypothetical protein
VTLFQGSKKQKALNEQNEARGATTKRKAGGDDEEEDEEEAPRKKKLRPVDPIAVMTLSDFLDEFGLREAVLRKTCLANFTGTKVALGCCVVPAVG